MSYHVFFSFSTGFTKSLKCPKGTYAQIKKHVKDIEESLGLKPEQYLNNPVHWNMFEFRKRIHDIPDELLCTEVSSHNRYIRRLYEEFAFWFKHPFTVGKGHQDTGINQGYPVGTKAERITPAMIREVWHGFELLEVPATKWTRDYYREQMDALYEVMRGRPTNGISFDVKALTEKQAASVINLFSEFLDAHDLRLDVPNGHDCLKSSYDGGYRWCEICGPVDENDIGERCANCPKKKCPIKEEYANEEE